MKAPSGGLRFFQGVVVGLIAGLLIAAVWLSPFLQPARTARSEPSGGKIRPAPARKHAAPTGVEKPAPFSLGKGPSPRAAIIIDDLGQDWKAAEELLAMEAELTFAILPHLPHSRRIAEEAHRRGREVLLHLPMEPRDPVANNPGPGALLSDMDRDVFRETLRKALDSVPHIVGVNNHMGSKLTEVGWAMELVIDTLKERRLFWVDSMTSPQSLGYVMAKKLGIGAARRRFFLDNDPSEEAIRETLERFADWTVRKGKAIAIGHPHRATRSALRAALPGIKAREIRIVPVSRLLE